MIGDLIISFGSEIIIIRNEDELNKIREYIQNNPLIWHLDRDNPEKVASDVLEDAIFKLVKGV
jgi:hypothetical protein